LSWTTNLEVSKCRTYQKACSITKIKYPPAQKPSGKVGRNPLKGKAFSQTPMDYKSIELDYRLLQGDYKF